MRKNRDDDDDDDDDNDDDDDEERGDYADDGWQPPWRKAVLYWMLPRED